MYKDYFNLEREPFRITPDIQSFFTGGDRGAILRAMIYAICNGDPIIKLIGEVGSGKTMLCRMLEQYLPQNVDIAYIANPRLTPDNILQTIAFELDLPLAPHDYNNRVLMLGVLQQFLVSAHMEGRQVVILVEEAQSIPIETLEEIRLLSNLETSQHKLLQIVLFGQPELDVILQTNSIRQISERIINSFYLPPLSKNDTADYICYRLHAAGHRGGNILSRRATKLIYRFSQGLLRRINILTDKALLAACQKKSTVVKKTHVIQALKEFPQHKSSFFSTRVIYPTLFSLLLTFSLGLAWQQISSQSQHPDFNQLPATNAGNPVRNTKTIKSTTLALPSRKVENLTQTSLKNSALSPFNFKQTLSRSQQWIKKVNRNHFTIQVLLTNADIKEELLQVFTKDSISIVSNKLYFFHTNLRGNPVLKVLYGEYVSYSAAVKALKNLPASLQQYQPYIRNIGAMLMAYSRIKAKRQEM
ncbi:hypothetical protein MNBD_GAMMA12-443 [hydrothermal vent metagenome]|uniref:AAA+ ATPase domain-containing protein n=1 Tax=hydrothermal vent metagenome TaxID=652676 RepID=A0A3B0YUU7_9ZZZZ